MTNKVIQTNYFILYSNGNPSHFNGHIMKYRNYPSDDEIMDYVYLITSYGLIGWKLILRDINYIDLNITIGGVIKGLLYNQDVNTENSPPLLFGNDNTVEGVYTEDFPPVICPIEWNGLDLFLTQIGSLQYFIYINSNKNSFNINLRDNTTYTIEFSSYITYPQRSVINDKVYDDTYSTKVFSINIIKDGEIIAHAKWSGMYFSHYLNHFNVCPSNKFYNNIVLIYNIIIKRRLSYNNIED